MLTAYLRERFHIRLFVPLAVLIALAASGTPRDWTTVALDAGFALLLLAQFRVWDDLADRSHDAVTHPERVLVRPRRRSATEGIHDGTLPEVTQVIAFCGALGVLNICLAVWRDASGIAVGLLGILNAVLGAWYLARTRRTAAGDHLLLAKYPAILLVVAGAQITAAPAQILGSAAVLYAAVCAYEVWHDRGGPLARNLFLGGS